MIFKQLFDNKSSTYTYIISSGKGREALIIDPVIENTPEYLRVLKVKYHLIRYEDLVSNFDISVNKLLNFLNLEWSDDINKFYDLVKDRGKISTPSYNQVNKPIYLKSVGRWKNYENKFNEIYPIIESWIKKFNY